MIINGAVRNAVKVILVLLGEFCSISSLHTKKGKMRRRQRTCRGYGVLRVRVPTPEGWRLPKPLPLRVRATGVAFALCTHKGHDADGLPCIASGCLSLFAISYVGINVFSLRCSLDAGPMEGCRPISDPCPCCFLRSIPYGDPCKFFFPEITTFPDKPFFC